MQYTKEDLNQLINVKLKEVPRKVMNDIFGYKDPKTLDRKIAGTMPLTTIDQMNIDVLSDSADAGVRHLYLKGTPIPKWDKVDESWDEIALRGLDDGYDDLTEIPGTGFYE